MARKLISTPKGTTAVLWMKKTYVVGDEVPDDFPEHMLRAPAEGEAAAPAAAEAGDAGKGKKAKEPKAKTAKAPKAKGKGK